MFSHIETQRTIFEIKNRKQLFDMYNEFINYWNQYPLEYHKKKPISYSDFVKYLFSISK